MVPAADMTSRGAAIPLDLVAAALGDVAVPGELRQLVESLSQRHPGALRLRRDVAAESLPMPTTRVAWYGLGRRPAADSPAPSRCLHYAAGDYYLQDAGSLLPLAAAGADTASLCGKMICDLCAAPGGKATALVEAVAAGAVGDGGFVLANEVIRSRLGALQLNLARTGSNRYAVSNLDPEKLAQLLPGVFDVVVVDAPCSGQSLMSRGKQNLSSLSASQIEHSASRQRRIIDSAVRLLRGGGQLIYSTCTFAESENEAQVDRLVAEGVAMPSPVERLASYESSRGCYRLWPHQHDCAGSFAASVTINRSEAIDHRRYRDRQAARLPGDLQSWYDSREPDERWVVRDSVVIGWPADAPAWLGEVALAGPEVAHRAGRTWKPAHAGALRRACGRRPRSGVEVDDQAAVMFMQGQPIPCSERGWHVVQWRGRPLGWIKADGKVGKNHLPRSAWLGGMIVSC